MKKICVLGSTGSIGVNTLQVIDEFPGEFEVVGLTVNNNITLLEKQIEKYHPKMVVVRDSRKARDLKKKMGNRCEVLTGDEGLIEITKNLDYDILLSSLVGFAGLSPTIEGIKRNKRIALANKETLVAAGQIIEQLMKKHDAEIIPVDSEHSAIFQCLVGEKNDEILKLILTASGGPFLSKSLDEFNKITVEQALAHPNWKMGNKITIDSATMMNKGLEVIEAHWLFNLPPEKIDVIVHPQSIIHSFVEFIDGSIKAQLSLPDMKLPIQYALSYPHRFDSNFVETKLHEIQNLSFQQPDLNKFRCLQLAYDALDLGGNAACALNAANEIAVNNFLERKISFDRIPDLIEEALNKAEHVSDPDLETIFETDRQTRLLVQNILN
ncbi:MAG: 1-deoxy-D-xylulose-5-phosphate reductoisomerase [Melioribacteraceae bacterium]|nr:1-deoxy-D-xylulose-5-phosphate reductoisomerase [Melioribacteraceae bacterium]MCF8354743.1 1-deoxy-D-xylulose-5-phosphate reductoisomerase [Melioribacteraceae bacterium]MCF8393235.1 1-deoxy-D-xylulose-5-phosphate reductoisomerase [Melioribacteraceae bacterium]MCF8417536.1 1-deoxy-D-xylulose-5-phosphate reductoisomerase [Melioribacteraceae bacterium]